MSRPGRKRWTYGRSGLPGAPCYFSGVFVGHLAVALAAKRAAPRTSLGLLGAASFGLDLLWPPAVLVGLETVRIEPGATAFTPLDFVSYPWTHSLVAAVAWGLLFGAGVLVATRDRAGAAVCALLVPSHWLLDALSHRPDMPLAPGAGTKVGLGLWNSVPATIAVEGCLFALGIAIYLRSTRPGSRGGTGPLFSLVALCTLIWLAGPFSPPPPSARAVAFVGLAMWLIPIWLGWADRRRQARTPG